MKVKKSILVSLMIIFVVAVCCLCGCTIVPANSGLSIVSIEKTQSGGLQDTYTITYSDGSTYTFEITNGKDGEDGKDLAIEDIYELYLETHPNVSYEEFLKDVLNFDSTSNTIAINKSLQSSAIVYTEFTQNYRATPFTVSKETAVYIGSAVVYKVEADYVYFITNYHIVYNNSALETDKIAKNIIIYLYGSESVPASTSTKDENGCTVYDYGQYGISCEYLGGSLTSDIAIVRAKTSDVKAINENVKEITFADNYCVGETAIAIGNPEGEGISVTEGIVSVDSEYINLNIDGTSRSYRCIRIDTAIYNGSSGGGLFNKNGELIGITNAGDGEAQNVNFAIPLEIVKGTVENIMYYGGNAKIITMGIQVISSNSKYVYSEEKGYGEIIETITVSNVIAGSITEALGLQVDDVILSFVVNGKEFAINRNYDIGDVLLTIKPNDEFYVKFTRAGQVTNSLTYTVKSSDVN